MQTSKRIFDDLAKVASGAASTLAGIKGEVDGLVRQQLQRLLNDAELVGRDEFEAVKAVAAKARSEQEKLTRRVKKLEAALAPKKAPAREKTRKKTRKKA